MYSMAILYLLDLFSFNFGSPFSQFIIFWTASSIHLILYTGKAYIIIPGITKIGVNNTKIINPKTSHPISAYGEKPAIINPAINNANYTA